MRFDAWSKVNREDLISKMLIKLTTAECQSGRRVVNWRLHITCCSEKNTKPVSKNPVIMEIQKFWSSFSRSHGNHQQDCFDHKIISNDSKFLQFLLTWCHRALYKVFVGGVIARQLVRFKFKHWVMTNASCISESSSW